MSHIKVEEELRKSPHISIVALVQYIIEHAVLVNASDIHVDNTESYIRVRFRIDGVVKEVYRLPIAITNEVIARIKIMGGLRTDEHAMPQDGRCRMSVPEPIDIRIAVTPTYYGEGVVLRLLKKNRTNITLSELGFELEDISKITAYLNKSHGLILVTGPTGSGKTTTLYALLHIISQRPISIVTIEDPIEYSIDSIRQIQVKPSIGLTFSHGLKSILRQDPEVIMVGEIRDVETASMAVTSALTGHLIISTLHTNDAPSSLARLTDMGVERYVLASVTEMVIAQRLVRILCDLCKEARACTVYERRIIEEWSSQRIKKSDIVHIARGCDKCDMTGYKGRTVIYEIMTITQGLRESIAQTAQSYVLKDKAVSDGMRTLQESGITKVLKGVTTLDEIFKVTDHYYEET